MPEGLVRRVRDGGVLDFVQGEALAGILHAAHNDALGADVPDLDILGRIEISAVLHGVQKDFAECASDFFLFGVREIASLAVELNQTVSSKNVAADGEADPVGCSSNEFDAFVPMRFVHSNTDHFRKLFRGERAREIAKGAFANGCQYVAGNEFVGEDDQAGMGANHAKLAK